MPDGPVHNVPAYPYPQHRTTSHLSAIALDRAATQHADILSDLGVGQRFPSQPARRTSLTFGRRQDPPTNTCEVDQIDMLVARADILEQDAIGLWQHADVPEHAALGQ